MIYVLMSYLNHLLLLSIEIYHDPNKYLSVDDPGMHQHVYYQTMILTQTLHTTNQQRSPKATISPKHVTCHMSCRHFTSPCQLVVQVVDDIHA